MSTWKLYGARDMEEVRITERNALFWQRCNLKPEGEARGLQWAEDKIASLPNGANGSVTARHRSVCHTIDISKFPKLIAFLKRTGDGYQAKKIENIDKE
ncbi:hypothetical protein NQ317_005928 [Molorchus minor]|uniref:Uncharacterized protein n=1 Tax=Molorchus minor TaxID=1323400 RepID=A0ABQ9IRM3_9CUCU|nr:hypothetical protein NQ317_005928 [Molorchus minor]